MYHIYSYVNKSHLKLLTLICILLLKVPIHIQFQIPHLLIIILAYNNSYTNSSMFLGSGGGWRDSHSGKSSYPHISSSSFHFAVFQHLHVPMRVREEKLQMRTLECLATCITPDCLITVDHLDFALDLLGGIQEKEGGEWDDDKNKNNKNNKNDNNTNINEYDNDDRYRNGSKRDRHRSASSGFETIHLEHCLTVILVSRSNHRLPEQHALASLGVDAFRFDQRLLLRALLCLAQIYEQCYELVVGTSLSPTSSKNPGGAPPTALAEMLTLDSSGSSHIGNSSFVVNSKNLEAAASSLLPHVGVGRIVEIMDLAPTNRKIHGAGLKVLSLLCGGKLATASDFSKLGSAGNASGAGARSLRVKTRDDYLSDPYAAYVLQVAQTALPTLNLSLRSFPESASVVLHGSELYHVIAKLDVTLLEPANAFAVLLAMCASTSAILGDERDQENEAQGAETHLIGAPSGPPTVSATTLETRLHIVGTLQIVADRLGTSYSAGLQAAFGGQSSSPLASVGLTAATPWTITNPRDVKQISTYLVRVI
jgi:hypothetical protein